MEYDELKTYYVMHKDIVTAIAEFTPDGNMLAYKANPKEEEHLPLYERKDPHSGLRKWWQQRSIPIDQGKIQEMLSKKGFTGPGQYLIKNLGLSLTDCYWIRPVDSDLKWADVNLFSNEFHDNMLVDFSKDPLDDTRNYSPNGSLKPRKNLDNSKWQKMPAERKSLNFIK